jgi:hypothetical protein
MSCGGCGASVAETANFCGTCGHPRSASRSAAVEASPAPAKGFVPLSRLAWWLVLLLGAGAVVDGLAALSSVSQVRLLERIEREEPIDPESVSWSDTRQQMIGLVQVLLFSATAFFFLRWIHRAYRNLPSLSSRTLSFGPGWAIGCWFVPFMNLVRPYRIVTEAWWVSSAPEEAERVAPDASPHAPASIKWWWALYLISGFLGQAVMRAGLSADTIPDLVAVSYMTLAADLIGIPSALLAIRVVRLITVAQGASARAFADAEPRLREQASA